MGYSISESYGMIYHGDRSSDGNVFLDVICGRNGAMVGVRNRCSNCKLLEVTTCPLLAVAYQRHGWEGLQHCEMGDAIERLYREIKPPGKFLK